jgi:hypothetical protein
MLFFAAGETPVGECSGSRRLPSSQGIISGPLFLAGSEKARRAPVSVGGCSPADGPASEPSVYVATSDDQVTEDTAGRIAGEGQQPSKEVLPCSCSKDPRARNRLMRRRLRAGGQGCDGAEGERSSRKRTTSKQANGAVFAVNLEK